MDGGREGGREGGTEGGRDRGRDRGRERVSHGRDEVIELTAVLGLCKQSLAPATC